MNNGSLLLFRTRGPRAMALPLLCPFVKTLSELLQAGIDLPWALQTVAGLTRDAALQRACHEQADALLDGQSWADVLRDARRPSWPDLFIAWASVAMQTGTAVECLDNLHREWKDQLDLQHEMARRMAYPGIVLALALCLSWFTGSQFDAGQAQTVWLAIGMVAAVMGLALATAFMLHKKDGLLELRCWCRCLNALALCCASGLSWPQSLDLLQTDLCDLWRKRGRIGQAFEDCAHAVKSGMGIHDAALAAGLPECLQRSLQLAEMTGNLTAALKQTAHLLHVQQGQLRQRLIASIPAAALALAGLTLAVQYAVFIQPLYAQLGAM